MVVKENPDRKKNSIVQKHKPNTINQNKKDIIVNATYLSRDKSNNVNISTTFQSQDTRNNGNTSITSSSQYKHKNGNTNIKSSSQDKNNKVRPILCYHQKTKKGATILM